MNPPNIAVLGLGAMGSRIAINLIGAGHSLTVWNRSPGASQALAPSNIGIATSPKKAAAQADIVISMVTDDDAAKAVWLNPDTGAAFGLTENTIAIECSTLTLKGIQAIEQTITATGASFVAAPVVGSRPQADAQKLISLVGGETHIVERIRPILSASSSAIHHIGTARQAMAMKLAVNSLFGIQVAALTELLGVLNQQGISPKEAMTYFSDMPVTSLVAKGAGTAIVNQQYAPMFPVQLVEKDFRYACQMVEGGEKSEKRMPATTAVQQIYQEAIAQGYGSENITAIAKLFL